MTEAGKEPSERSLAVRTAAGFGWVMAWRLVTRVLGVASTLILVRILLPSDFGLVALAMSVIATVELLSVLGVQEAVVRHPAPTRDVYDTAFTIGLARACMNAAITAAVAWPVAAFFEEPRLVPIMLAAAAGLVITSLDNIGVVEFRRDLAFDKDLRLRIYPRLAGIVVTIAIAVTFHSYWALVIGMLVNRVGGTVMTYTFHPHRPRVTLVAWRELSDFSLWMWACGLVGLLRDRAEVFIIGRLLGTGPVGTYTVAAEIATLPMTELTMPLAQVLFSSFARAAGDDAASRQIFLRFVGLLAIIGIPAGVGIALLAEPLTHIVLGPNWGQAVPVLQILAVGCAATTFGMLARPVMEARGRMTMVFSATLAGAVVRIGAGIPLVSAYGIAGGAMGFVGGWAIDQIVLVRTACRTLSLSWWIIVGRVVRPVLAAGVMSAALLAAGLDAHVADAGPAAQIVRLLASVLGGAAVYGVVILLAWLVLRRPAGAEADVLRAAVHTLGRWRPRRASA